MHVARLPVALKHCLPPRRGLRQEWVFGALQLAIDAVSFSILYLACLKGRQPLTSEFAEPFKANMAPSVLCVGALILIFTATGRYSLSGDIQSVRFAAEHLLACVGAFFLALLLQFSVFLFDLSRSRLALLVAFLAFTPLSLLVRRVLGRAFAARARGRTLLVIGAGEEARQLHRACRNNGWPQELRFVDLGGSCPHGRIDGPGSPRVEAAWDDLPAMLDREIEAIVMAGPFPKLAGPGVEALVRIHFYHIPIFTLEAFYERHWRKIPAGEMDPTWALRQDFRLARDSSYRFFKRALDVVFSAAGLTLFAPLLLLCAVAVRMEDGGPVFYSQRRMRRDRQTFQLHKLRTMRASGAANARLYTHHGDDRVTRVGQCLRRLRLDELPQFWNVLLGDMSLIGPRAEWTRCVELYEKAIPGYHFRHLVKPGITGWAQVNYPYGQSVEDAVRKLEYDLYYIKNYSLLLDAAILLKTLYVVLSCKGR